MINLDKMLDRANGVKNRPEHERGLHLHLGCGPQILPGYVNIDKYHEDDRVIKHDISDLTPFKGLVTTIYSSHALEHLPIRKSRSALISWGLSLKKDGRLYLAIPDLEEICRKVLDKSVPLSERENWYAYTMFGYQIDTNIKNDDPIAKHAKEDPGQFHTCGFTEETISHYLIDAGLKIDLMFKYDGWGTPSLWVEASKK